MSEEILKALMQLFAIIAKQDDGVKENEREFVRVFLKQQVSETKVVEYLALFDKKSGYGKPEKKEKKKRLTSVGDSVRILGISKKINKTLTQKQKVIVLVRLFELVNSDKKFTEQRMAIINTVAEVFNIPASEIFNIEKFVVTDFYEELFNISDILLIGDNIKKDDAQCLFIQADSFDKPIIVLRVESTEQYFIRYSGRLDFYLNGLIHDRQKIHILANGSTIRLSKGKPIYFSDVVAQFKKDVAEVELSFEAQNIEYKFPAGNIGLHDINLKENHGKLIAIMGASGAGKTTLLNVLSGINEPSKGRVLINNIDLFKEKDKLEGIIGYIPQDDLLIEELTVFQNLYYNAKLCFRNLNNEEITKLVDKTLKNLGLLQIKHLKVGNPLNKFISGGQRKRLNIALELIREPSILFVDEPTSGLSSRDSENVMDLLRELSLKGKLIFVVIHQPSSDIYKMFDKVIILDTGGYQVYYGNPVEAVMYFKRLDAQINSDTGECPVCGNVNSELIFNIIEARVVNEYGEYQEERKVKPQEWAAHYQEYKKEEENFKIISEEPPKILNIPNWFKQIKIYFTRDFLSKISNTQYVLLNMLEAPVLAFILSYIIRYIADPNSNLYIFRENENIPPYIFMSIVVALFLGLTVSAEEIFRDRNILKREKFLNLSRSSYLLSKVFILLLISAIQTITFVLIGNYILGVRDMNTAYWIVLFSTSVFANMLGLNISATFNSAVTIYIIIPLVLIPQMVLGGAMFSFEKLNKNISSVDKVPLLAEMMTSKWAYEALMVHQFKDNKFEKPFYQIEKEMSNANFKQVYLIPELKEKLNQCFENKDLNKDEINKEIDLNLSMIRKELKKEKAHIKGLTDNFLATLVRDSLSDYNKYMTESFLNDLDEYYGKIFNEAYNKKEKIVNYFIDNKPELFKLNKDNYYNESVSDIVKKVFEKNKIIQIDDRLVQQIDLIYLDPKPQGYFDFRSHFYAPRKYFAGKFYDTFYFNVAFIWFLTILLYISLYFDLFKKLINIKIKK